MKLKTLVVGIGLLVLAITLSGLAQTPAQASASQEEKPKTESRSPYRVVIFDVKHRNAEAVARALVGSGGQGTQIVPNLALKTITVRDYPESIAVIGEAIKRFDTPTPSVSSVPDSLEFQVHLVAASQAVGERSAMPANLEKVVQQIKTSLPNGDYRFLTTLTSRVIDGGSIHANGYISPPFPVVGSLLRSSYSYELQRVNIISDAAGKEAYQIRVFKFTIGIPIVSAPGSPVQMQSVGIQTELSLREGETAVVGTANVGGSDEAIIVVVTARKVK